LTQSISLSLSLNSTPYALNPAALQFFINKKRLENIMAKVSREKFKVFEGVFDEFTLNTLETLKRKKYFDELGTAIKTGKEGDVYFGYRDDKVLAIKIYRMTSANFKKISQYIQKDFEWQSESYLVFLKNQKLYLKMFLKGESRFCR